MQSYKSFSYFGAGERIFFEKKRGRLFPFVRGGRKGIGWKSLGVEKSRVVEGGNRCSEGLQRKCFAGFSGAKDGFLRKMMRGLAVKG